MAKPGIRTAKHFMIDTETLGLEPTAAIWEVTVMDFAQHSDGMAVPLTSVTALMLPSSVAREIEVGNLTYDKGTIAWSHSHGAPYFGEYWSAVEMCRPNLDQPHVVTAADQAVAALASRLGYGTWYDRQDWLTGMAQMGVDKQSQVWVKGASFDFPKLAHHTGRANLPWHYRNENCMRTVQNMARRLDHSYDPKPGIAHTSYEDCVQQCALLTEAQQIIMRALR